MDSQGHSGITHWGLIIGINHYSDPRDNLRGSVNDANFMRKYLELSIGPSLDIISLTATTPAISSNPPSEEPQSLPTHSNIVAHLGYIADQARPGNRVIIYFAGHGAYIPADSTHALVVLAKKGTAKQYLRLDALYRRVELLITKGLAVTLILDCCYSGAIVRGDEEVATKVRCLEYDPTVALDSESPIIDSGSPMRLRDAVMEFNWLKYDTNLVVLCACAPHERTFETLLDEKVQGVFTRHLLHALNKLVTNGMIITHKAIHEHLGSSLHADWPRQTPMRYGKADDVLFGDSLLAPEKASISVYMKDNGGLCLRAGEVHGIVTGDEFYVSLASTDSAGQKIANVRTTVVRVAESDLEIIEDRLRAVRAASSQSWKAKPASSLSPRVISVSIPPGLVNVQSMSQDTDRYLKLIESQHDDRALRRDSCLYSVIVNSNDQYEITDAIMERVPNIPTIARNSDESADRIVRILRHIAEFKYFEGLENRVPCPELQASFHVDCSIPPGSSNKIEVKRNDKIKFSFTNTSDEELYVFAFDFGPTWQMKAFYGQGCEILPARRGDKNGILRVPVRLRWPEDLPVIPQQYCEDHIKFIITNESTHFPWSLPTIFKTIEGSKDSHRGDSEGLHVALNSLFGGFRDDRKGKWTTRSFFVRTWSGEAESSS